MNEDDEGIEGRRDVVSLESERERKCNLYSQFSDVNFTSQLAK